MTCATGPGVSVVLTDAAVAALGSPILPLLWRLLEAHGRGCSPSEHDVHGRRLRIVSDGQGGLVVGVLADFAEAAA